MTDEQRLTELNITLAEWEQRRDEDAIQCLDKCLSHDLVFRRADRTFVGKAAFMNALRGPSPFVRRESRNVTVDLMGDRALVVLTVIGTRDNGSQGVYRNIRVFFHADDGEWRLEVWWNDDITSFAEV